MISISAQAAGDFIVDWNDAALDTVRSERLGAAPASRLYALTNAAVYDAVNGIDVAQGRSDRPSLLVSVKQAPRKASRAAAAAAAAHAVLSAVSPARATEFDTLLAVHLSALGRGRRVRAGRAWGEYVGSAAVAARADDGTQIQEILPAGTAPGV
ncbi:MAG: PA-phosphatase, partial [Pseudomonadota bacterium]